MDRLSTREILTLDASALRARMEDGLLTSVELVSKCLDQISTHDRSGGNLKAVINTAPRDLLLNRAKELDDERQNGRIRSKLHGIPILVKDCIATDARFGLKTTVGSLALHDSNPQKTSPIIDMLDQMGAIIIAKTNLNLAFANTNGWSAMVGQTQSAYITFDPTDTSMGHTNPCGSSTGSAVGVSAGYAPLALGTDSIGSLVSPATRAALYTLKPTIGSVDLTAIYPVSRLFDMVGGLTKTVADLATITTCLVKSGSPENHQPRDFEECLSHKFDGLRIGFLDPQKWMMPDNVIRPIQQVQEQIINDTEAVIESIKKHDKVYVEYPVDLPPISALERDGKDTMTRAITYEIQPGVANYLSNAGVDTIKPVQDIVQFNEDHAADELPPDHSEQDWLLSSFEDSPSEEQRDLDVAHFQRVARTEGFDKLFIDKQLDIVAFSMDSLAFVMASAAGCPIGTVPQGILKYNGRPFGLGIVAQPGREDLMFRFMSAYEAHFPPRQIPPRLLSNDEAQG